MEHSTGTWETQEVRPWPNNPHVADIVVRTTYGRPICRISALPYLEEMQANARLIAAAPLMYEALQDLIEVAKMEDWQYATTGRQILLKNAQAALAAAGATDE